jgi:hypothetical protein
VSEQMEMKYIVLHQVYVHLLYVDYV